MLPTTKMVSIMLLLAITSVANAQSEEPVSEYPSKVEYHGSPDLPNGVAFYAMLYRLDSNNTQFGPANPAGIVKYELGLNNVDAHAFVSDALTTLYYIETDIRAQLSRIACEYGLPSASKNNQFTALQQMYNVEKAITDHHFEQTKASLDDAAADRLQQWMDKRKLTMGYVELDFQKSYEISGDDPGVTLSGLCRSQRINSNQ